jgi:hypothetical protein
MSVNQPNFAGNTKPGSLEILNLIGAEVVTLSGTFWTQAIQNFNFTDMQQVAEFITKTLAT